MIWFAHVKSVQASFFFKVSNEITFEKTRSLIQSTMHVCMYMNLYLYAIIQWQGCFYPSSALMSLFLVVQGYAIIEGRPFQEPRLPCCGIGMGWFL